MCQHWRECFEGMGEFRLERRVDLGANKYKSSILEVPALPR
jgi:hypothetical protein